jgi:hypothetical protein
VLSMPVQQDTTWESLLLHFAGTYHATMQGLQLSYTNPFDR